ncbi:glutathione S-transferase T3-like [Miscanthus floridulus]|uniref:glutathione S-transferase T3-like n=1 Tax=Miscanthus floridulus TaxID=154761 RepID=UPI003458D342
MNLLRPPSSSSRQGRTWEGRTGQGRGAPVALATRSDSVVGAPVAPDDGSSSAAGYPSRVTAAASPPLPSLQAARLPTWWTNSSPMGSNEGMYPPGGFTNFLQSNGSPENFHLVGNTTSRTTISQTAPSLKRTLESNAEDKETINIDADETNEDERTERRLNWTKPEDVRLASAWLRNSKDPVDGTDRKADQYWADVIEEYNKNIEVCRRRNQNQLKIRWDRVKKPVMDFHGCWNRTTKVYRSGVSDDQLMEIAEKMYAGEHNDKEFTLKHFWKVVRNERKWSAYVKKEQEKEKNKCAVDSPSEVVNLEDNPKIRPIGHKKAKAELYGKKKTPEAFSAITDKLDKFIEVSTLARKDHEKMAETQQIMAKSKVEAARLTDKAAEKQLKCKMLDTYRELLLAPTTNMNAHALAEREKALESMRLALFGTNN